MEIMQSNGWVFKNLTNSMSQCMPFTSTVPDVCGMDGSTWYGWGCGNKAGSITTLLRGSGVATLHYGNCGDSGKVNVYLNGTKILSSPPGRKSLQSFDYYDGNELKITDEEGNGIIQIISITFACKGAIYFHVICVLLFYSLS